MASLVDYKGFGIVDPEPSGECGIALNDNFKRAGDSLVGPTTTLYVDGTRDDAYDADGSIYRPFKVVQDAVDAALGITSHAVLINIGPGRYDEDVEVAFPTGVYRLSMRGAGTGSGNSTMVGTINFILPNNSSSNTQVSLADLTFNTGVAMSQQSAMKITDAANAGFALFFLTGVQCWTRRDSDYALHVTNNGGGGFLQVRCDSHCVIKSDENTSDPGDSVTALRLERGDFVAVATGLVGLRAPAIIASGTSSVSLSDCYLDVALGTAGAAHIDCVQGSDTANINIRYATMTPAGNGHVISHSGTFNGTRGLVVASDIGAVLGAGTGGVYLPAGALLIGGQMSSEAGVPLPVTVASPALRVYLPHDVNVGFTAATPGNWASPAPTNVRDAINRIAAEVATLKGGPIS